MRVLALDTTTRAGSVALVEDDRVIAEHAGDPARSHAERLPGDLTRALDAVGWAVASIDVFAVVAGPGSFTGLRIGIATMQGLAFVRGRKVVPVSTLEALAHVASAGLAPGAVVGALVDGHRHEVFSGLYRIADSAPFSPERVVLVEPEGVGDPKAVLARWAGLVPQVSVFVGDGAVVYEAELSGRGSVAGAPTLAAAAGLLAIFRAARGEAVNPSALHPIYIRRPDVELAREREQSAR